MRKRSRASYVNGVILGRRRYRDRQNRLQLQKALGVVEVEFTRFAIGIVEEISQRKPGKRDPLLDLHTVGESSNWRQVCETLSQQITGQLSQYFRRPMAHLIVKTPALPNGHMAMVSAVYHEECLTHSMSILAEHLLSNVWGSFHLPWITAIGNEIVSEAFKAGSKMLRQFDLSPEQVHESQAQYMQRVLIGKLNAGISQVRSEVAGGLYNTIKEMDRVTYGAKYELMLRRRRARKVRHELRLVAD